MSGNDRRTALLGRLEKIRELIASFFRALVQDGVHHEATVQHRTESVNIIWPPVGRRCFRGSCTGLSTPTALFPGRVRDERTQGGAIAESHDLNRTGTISMKRHSDNLSPPNIKQDGRSSVSHQNPRGSQFYSEWWQIGAPEEIRTPDPQIRSLVLYPAELRARFSLNVVMGLIGPMHPRVVRKRRERAL
jgi:hypothetical protein